MFNNLGKVKEINEVLDTSESLKLNQEETSNLDRPITNRA